MEDCSSIVKDASPPKTAIGTSFATALRSPGCCALPRLSDARGPGLCTGSCRRGTRHGTAVSLVPDFEAAAHWPGSPTRTQAESTSPPSDSTAQVALIEPANGLAAYPAMTPTGHAAFGVQNSNLKQNQGPKVLDGSLVRGPLQCQSEHYNSCRPLRSR